MSRKTASIRFGLSTDPQSHPYRRCFVSGNDPATTLRLVEMIRALGIEAASTDQIRVGQTITQEVVRLITNADFIAVVIADRAQAFAALRMPFVAIASVI